MQLNDLALSVCSERVEALAACPQLKTLVLRSNRIASLSVLEPLQSMPQLQHLVLEVRPFEHIAGWRY